MTRARNRALATARRAPSLACPIRLDLIANPYGPSIRVQEALASADDLHLSDPRREARLRKRLAQMLSVPPAWLTLAGGIDELLTMILLWRRGRGPLVLFPPTDPEDERRAQLLGVPVVLSPRSHRFGVQVDAAGIPGLPRTATALVTSPNDPTGTILGSQEAVRLSRCCEMVVIDERHGEYAGRSLVPLVREFENVVVLQTMETWAGLAGLPIAYAIAPPRLSSQLQQVRLRRAVPTAALIAAEATLDDLAYVRATVQRVAEEKSRLFRTLRKLNMLRPLPSWANFLLARVERGEIAVIHQELARRDIYVHRPAHPPLVDCLRVSAAGPESTTALKEALIEIAARI